MHTDLAPHLHTPECNAIITALRKCHKQYPFRKFFGVCNELDFQQSRCLKQERLARRERNVDREKFDAMNEQRRKKFEARKATMESPTSTSS
ncbi:hypothetical protein CAPTEDRAFT_220055 [Capitella teleta]|uniref:COX assembly mitochondrial protein n=1 Tax=Capitella teleta TaxID=283909 RepID=R7T8I5_CAPTE|nr:hypothetical protein CAPTEDRAFT_220055 [Capitella teleta]|eukprot:ELT87309.1 hypothetical protein CAPTEDRAFT_220055 [Capitella teleta]